jgi:hypothetical protein
MNHPTLVKGSLRGLWFPTTIESLREQGTKFLTDAFRASNLLSDDNAVAAITEDTEFYGGGMGRKLLLSVEYRHPVPGLPTRLFVKFPRDFGDPLRELFTPLMEPEARFALLSRRAGFPITVPRCFFAEYDADTMCGILITERIAYGEDGIEPARDKCMDYQLENPLRHYRTLAKSMATLAGAHRAGRLGSDVDNQFPFQRAAGVIPYGMVELRAKLHALNEFAAKVPQLFPHGLGSRAFLESFAQDAEYFLEHQAAVAAHLNDQVDQIAFCHMNTNIDNAWFWTDADGELQAGLLDWGGVGQMHLACGFYGLICSAETAFLDSNRDTLIALIADQYRSSGGPAIDVSEFTRSVTLACGAMGLAWMMDAPALIAASVPDYSTVKSRFDPKLESNFLARVQLQPLIVLLNEWRNRGIGSAVRKLATER